MNKFNDGVDILSIFGLTGKQTIILFSIEKMLVQKDIQISKKYKEEKQKWLNEWSASINDYLTKAYPDESCNFLTQKEILDKIAFEHSLDINNTWYYLIILEATLFVPYTSIEKNKKDDKIYSKLKYKEQYDIIKEIVHENEIMEEIFIERFKKTYSKSISKLTGIVNKNLLRVVNGTIAVAVIFAAIAGIFKSKIAVALFGSQFVGLYGAVLINACLAMAGGGAIAAGGAGMLGGKIIIIGGGALLGMAVGGTAIGGTALFVTSTPQLALTQVAKLEVVLKEIIINVYKDIKCAQHVLENYKNQIVNFHSQLAKIKLDREENKKTINNMKKSLEYMEKAYKDIMKFVSSYEVGTGEMD